MTEDRSSLTGETSNSDIGEESEGDRRCLRRPKDEALAKAWDIIQQTPTLYLPRDMNTKRAYEDMLRQQMRVAVDLPWFVNAETVVPGDAWPDHKAITRFWRVQGDRGRVFRTDLHPKPRISRTG